MIHFGWIHSPTECIIETAIRSDCVLYHTLENPQVNHHAMALVSGGESMLDILGNIPSMHFTMLIDRAWCGAEKEKDIVADLCKIYKSQMDEKKEEIDEKVSKEGGSKGKEKSTEV